MDMKGIVFAALVIAVACLVVLVSVGMGNRRAQRLGIEVDSATGSSQASVETEGDAGDAAADTAAQADSTEVSARHAGLDVFLAQRCERCHTVRVAGIGVPDEREGQAEDDDPMDLSDAGETRTAEWLRLYLRREESIDGAKHYKAFDGTEEEEAALVEWLMQLAVPEEEAEEASEDTGTQANEAPEGPSDDTEGSAEVSDGPAGETEPPSETED
jgi:hypothetical protein